MKAKHLPGFDGLRFVSSAFVVLHHLFTFKWDYGFVAYGYPIVAGFYGLQFFFVGSGFLITYLLVKEKNETGKINLKDFFFRRILRIWPGYYLLILIVLIGVLKHPFFYIPNYTDFYLSSNYTKANKLFYWFLPHLTSFYSPTAPYLHHTWTIGIEEQFYILWGVLFYFFRRQMFWFLIVTAAGMPLLNALHNYLYIYNEKHTSTLFSVIVTKGITYLSYSRLSTFAIGSLFGYAYYHESKWIHYFKRKDIQLLVYCVLMLSILTEFVPPFFYYEYMALIMSCIMLSATFYKHSLIDYNKRWMQHLGKISYGTYLFHMFAIVFAIKSINYFHLDKGSFFTLLLLCFLTLLYSMIFGWLSYYCFEIYFLKLKQRFKKVNASASI